MPASAMGQLPSPSIDAVIDAAIDCAEAAVPGSVDGSALEKAGWRRANMSSGDKPIETPLRIYGKGGTSPILLITDSGGAAGTGCLITGALKNKRSFGKLKTAMSEAFETAGEKDDSAYFRIGSDIAILSETGSRKARSFRIGVIDTRDQ